MTDRDPNAANSPDPDDVPREPSRAELDDAMRTDGDVDAARRGELAPDAAGRGPGDLSAAPAVEDAAPARVTYPPSKAAVIAGALLSALMLGLMILAWTQQPREYMPEYNRLQIQGVAQLLEDQDVAEYTGDEVTAAQQAFADAGNDRNMTSESAAQALNSAKPDSVTPADIDDVLAEAEASFQTLEGIESNLRSQIILFAVAGGLLALAVVFYQRGKVWARFVAMFVSGFTAVMYVMQVLQGALNILGLVIVVVSAATFYLFMKGRLDEPPAARPRGGAGGGGLSSLFAPRPKPAK